jgi:hypothetical protein
VHAAPATLRPTRWAAAILEDDSVISIQRLAATVALAASASCFAAQPNMEAALASLQQAKDSLQQATADKGGHRARAMKMVEDAIKEVKTGIEYDKANTANDVKKP